MGVPLTARTAIPFWPPALLSRNEELATAEKPQISITVRIPTMFERDAFSAALVRGGVVSYSQAQVRDLMKAGIAFLYPIEQFDKILGSLEDLWTARDAQVECESKRLDLYLKLMEKQNALPPDERMGETEMEEELKTIQPSVIMPEPDRVRVTAMQQDIMARYAPMQQTLADLAEQDLKRNWICIECYVQTWTGLAHTPDGNDRGGVTRREAEYLRGQVGEKAFNQIAQFIFAMHSIDGDEEKNLDLLIENSSAAIGSTLAESMKPPSNGNSTGEPISETPDISSPKTVESSSSSGKSSAAKTGRSRRTPTAPPSSTSPSSS